MRRLLVLVVAAALSLMTAVPAAAESDEREGGYLALGDSVAFGTDPSAGAPIDAGRFTGYPEIVARALETGHVNAACPGEATGGFIDPKGLDNVCRPYRAVYPLHTGYTGTQLAFAVDYLRSHRDTRLVTINLGANDAFRVQKGSTGADYWPPSTCYTPNLALYFTTCAVDNLKTIFKAIRGTGYRGLIVALTYYSLDYQDPAAIAGTQLLNSSMIAAGQSYGVVIASGFDAFQPLSMLAGGSACNAGLLVRLTPASCDIHPSPLGRDLLAAAILSAIAKACRGELDDCLEPERD